MLSRCLWTAALAVACLPAQTQQVMKYQTMTVTGGADVQPTRGAPYTAVAVTEFVQTLADGNRITSKNTSSVARDSEGRTRREQSMPPIGPFSAEQAGKAPNLIFIQDPVARTSYVIDPASRTARKRPFIQLSVSGEGGNWIARETRTMNAVKVRPPAGEAGFNVKGAPPPPPPPGEPARGDMVYFSVAVPSLDEQTSKESLGSQVMEGLSVTGTRMTRTIPAGAMGNERPIQTVTESWYSPDLQQVIYSKRSDPRMGDDTYQLTNIRREEPPASLFTIPADYKVVDDTPGEPAPMIQFQQKLLP